MSWEEFEAISKTDFMAKEVQKFKDAIYRQNELNKNGKTKAKESKGKTKQKATTNKSSGKQKKSKTSSTTTKS